MAIDDSSSASIFAPWPDRLRHSAIILLAAGLALCALVVLADLSPARAVAVHDWIWHRRGEGFVVSFLLLKRLNLVRR